MGDFNSELYEGIRFAWIEYKGNGTLKITNMTAVAQIRPVEYIGTFESSSSPMLEKIFYAGAYGLRVNMHSADLGSILNDRGDRKAFQGDNNVAGAVAMAVFGKQSFPLVLANLNATNSGPVKGHAVHDSNLVPYPLYWVQSVCDYFWQSGDAWAFEWFSADVAAILNAHVQDAQSNWLNVRLNFFGWDDRVRVGSGEKGFGGLEPQLAYVSLLVQSCKYFARSLNASSASHALASNFTSLAAVLTARLKGRKSIGGGPYWADYGVHAAAHLLSAEIPTSEEALAIRKHVFNDATTICSWSPFNTYVRISSPLALLVASFNIFSACSSS